jgi:hypothetical protein
MALGIGNEPQDPAIRNWEPDTGNKNRVQLLRNGNQEPGTATRHRNHHTEQCRSILGVGTTTHNRADLY